MQKEDKNHQKRLQILDPEISKKLGQEGVGKPCNKGKRPEEITGNVMDGEQPNKENDVTNKHTMIQK